MKFITIIFLIILNSLSYSQITAITEKGDTVLLKKDGTWEFKTEFSAAHLNEQSTVDTNSTFFKKDYLAQQIVKGQKVDYEMWYNSSKWKLTNLNNSYAEYGFKYENGDAYCMIIPDSISVTVDELKKIALINAKNTAQNIRVVHEDIRNVNGTYVDMMEFKGEVQGLKFIYFCYYYANKKSSIQLITFTMQNYFDQYKNELQTMLNGFVIAKK